MADTKLLTIEEFLASQKKKQQDQNQDVVIADPKVQDITGDTSEYDDFVQQMLKEVKGEPEKEEQVQPQQQQQPKKQGRSGPPIRQGVGYIPGAHLGGSFDDAYDGEFGKAIESTAKNYTAGVLTAAGKAIEHTSQLDLDKKFVKEYPVKELEKEQAQKKDAAIYRSFGDDPNFLARLGYASPLSQQLLERRAGAPIKPITDPTHWDDEIQELEATAAKLHDSAALSSMTGIKEDVPEYNDTLKRLRELKYKKSLVEKYGNLDTAFNEISAQVRDKNHIAERIMSKADAIAESAPEFDPYTVGGFMGAALVNMLPSALVLAATPFTSGTSLAALPYLMGMANISFLSTAAGGMAIREYEDYVRDKGMEPDPETMAKVFIAHAGAEFLTETIRLPRWLPKGMLNKHITKGVIESGGLKQIDDMLLQYSKQTGKSYKPLLKNLFKQFREEGSEELVAETLGQLSDMGLYLDQKDFPSLQEFVGQLAYAGAQGGMVGFFMGGAGSAVQSHMRKKAREHNGFVTLAETTDESLPAVVEVVGKHNDVYLAYTPEGEQVMLKPEQLGHVEYIEMDDWNNYQTALQREQGEHVQLGKELAVKQQQIKNMEAAEYVATKSKREDGERILVHLTDPGEGAPKVGWVTGGEFALDPTTGKITFTDEIVYVWDPQTGETLPHKSNDFYKVEHVLGTDQEIAAELFQAFEALRQDQEQDPLEKSGDTKAIEDKVTVGLQVADPVTGSTYEVVDVSGINDDTIVINITDPQGNENVTEYTVDETLALFEQSIAEREARAQAREQEREIEKQQEVEQVEQPAVEQKDDIKPKTEPQPQQLQFPLTKDGQPDIDKMNRAQLFEYTKQEMGEETARQDLQDEIALVDKKIADIEKKMASQDMKAKVKSRQQLAQLKADKTEIEGLMPQVEADQQLQTNEQNDQRQPLPEAGQEKGQEAPQVRQEQGQKDEQGEVKPVELTDEQKQQRQNNLVALLRKYNNTPKSHSRKRSEMMTRINQITSTMGDVSVTTDNGKLVVLGPDGKPIRKIAVKVPQQEIDAHKSPQDYDEPLRNFIERNLQNPNVLLLGDGVDFGMTLTERKQAVRNLLEGKKTVAANTMLDVLEQIYEDKGVAVFQQLGNTRGDYNQIDIQQIEESLAEAENPEQNPEYTEMLAQVDETLSSVVTTDFIDEETGQINWNELSLKLEQDPGYFSGFPFDLTESEIQELNRIIQDEQARQAYQQHADSQRPQQRPGETDGESQGDNTTGDGPAVEGQAEPANWQPGDTFPSATGEVTIKQVVGRAASGLIEVITEEGGRAFLPTKKAQEQQHGQDQDQQADDQPIQAVRDEQDGVIDQDEEIPAVEGESAAGQQDTPQPAQIDQAAAQAEQGQPIIPPDGWRGDLMKSRKYASELFTTNELDKLRDADAVDWSDAKSIEALIDKKLAESKPTIKDIADASDGRINIVKPGVTPQSDYGADNKIVSKDRYEELKKRMRDKLNNMNVGFDFEMLAIGTEMAAHHIEAGARKFSDFAKRMIGELGDGIKPYLKAFYKGARMMPEMESYQNEMDAEAKDGVPLFLIAGEKGTTMLKRTPSRKAEAEIRLADLEVARQMEAVKRDAKAIRKATGWERGADGKWRYEILDGKVTMKPTGVYNLGEMLDNKELYKLYPNLQYSVVEVEIGEGKENHGSYFMDKETGTNKIKLSATNNENAKTILLHEVQHAIQEREGFAKGGSPDVMTQSSAELTEMIADVEGLVRLAEENKTTLADAYERTKDAWKHDDIVGRNAKKDIKEVKDLLKQLKPGTLSPQQQYHRLAGEVEARNVEARQNLTSGQRLETMLHDTEDVSREDQILLSSAIESAMMSDPNSNNNEDKRTAIRSLLKQSDDGVRTVIVDNQSELPASVREKIPQQVRPPGMYDRNNNTSYYILDNMRSVSDAVNTWFHEQGVHHGLTKLIPEGEERTRLFERVIEDIGLENAMKVLPDFYNTPDNIENKAILGEEYIAHLADRLRRGKTLTAPQRSVWQRFMDAIRKWMADTFGWTPRITDMDVARIAQAAIDSNFQKEGGEALKQNRANIRRLIRLGDVGAVAQGQHGRVPTQIKSATGNDGTFDSQTPDIRFKSDNTEPAYTPGKSIAEQYKFGTSAHLREAVQDKYIRLKSLKELVLSRQGRVPEWADPYLHATLVQSINDAEMKLYDRKIWEPLMQTVKAIVQDKGIEIENLQKYMKAKHAPERNAAIRKKYGKKPDDETVYAGSLDGVPLTDEYASQVADMYEQIIGQELYVQLWDGINDATIYSLDKYLDAGFINQQTYDELTGPGGYQFYVPLRGWKGETLADIYDYHLSDPYSGFQNPMKQAFGRDSEADDPLMMIKSMAHSSIMAGNKNRFKQKLLNMVRINRDDMSDVFDYKRIYLVDTGTVDQEGNPVIKEALFMGEKVFYIDGYNADGSPQLTDAGTFADLKEEGRIKFQQSMGHYRRNAAGNAQQHEVNVFEGGRRYVLVMKEDPGIARAINGENDIGRFMVNSVRLQKALDLPATMTRYLSMVLTSKNPAFIPVNFIRDIGYATMAHGIKDSGDVRKFYSNIGKAAKAIHRFESGKADPKNNADDAMFERFLKAGGRTGYAHINSLEEYRKDIRKNIERLTGTNGNWDKVAHGKVIQGLGFALDYLAIMSEDTARYATFLTSKQKGASDDRAGFDSKNSTVNFNQKGRIAPLLGSFYAFANAAIQGGANMAGLAKNNTANFSKFTGSFAVLGFMIAEMMKMVMDDDDDYYQINEYLRDNYMILPNPAWWWGKAKDKYVSIPMPHGFRAFYAVGSIVSDLLHGKSDPMGATYRMMGNVADTFSPWNFNFERIGEGTASARPFIPTWYVPFYDIQQNRDFANRPVFRQMFTPTQELYTPAAEKGLATTNPMFRKVARELNRLGGGDENRPASLTYDPNTGEVTRQPWKKWIFEVNPAKVEHLLEGFTGGTGAFINQTFKTTHNAFRMHLLNDPDASIDTRDVPIMNRLYRTIYTSSTVSDYWELKSQVSDYKNYRRVYKYKTPEMERNAKFVDKTEKRLRAYKKRIEAAQENPKLRQELIKDRNEFIESQMKEYKQQQE